MLYLFLWQLLAVIWRDLQRKGSGEAEPSQAIARLLVLDGGSTSYRAGHSFPIHQTTTIGRGADNTIVLSDAFVSSNHVRLVWEEGLCSLQDLGSRNGTAVNGEVVEEDVPIHYGDVITIGRVRLKLAR